MLAQLGGLLWSGGRSQVDRRNTFRPVRQHRVGSRRYELHKLAQTTLGTGDLREAVTLPQGEDVNEWLAVHTIDFYNEINLVYGIVSEFCTAHSCPRMCAGPKYEYAWADGAGARPRVVSARQYVDFLMTWVQQQLDDEAIFPTTPGKPFPRDFRDRVCVIFRRMFRVYAHLYYHHFTGENGMAALGANMHLNTCFKHFVYFVKEFDLICSRELEPLHELIERLLERDHGRFGTPRAPPHSRAAAPATPSAVDASVRRDQSPTPRSPPPTDVPANAAGAAPTRPSQHELNVAATAAEIVAGRWSFAGSGFDDLGAAARNATDLLAVRDTQERVDERLACHVAQGEWGGE